MKLNLPMGESITLYNTNIHKILTAQKDYIKSPTQNVLKDLFRWD